MKIPKKTKFKKWHTKKIIKFNCLWSKGNNFLIFGFYGLRSKSFGLLTAKHIENIRIITNRIIQQKGFLKMWFKIFPQIPITKKPKSTRMGKGKGSVRFWVCKIHIGIIILELGNINKTAVLLAFNTIQKKIPFLTDIVFR